MRILDRKTKPPTASFTRLHRPRETKGKFGYQKYRSCLRWDFGFTCPFCLLHEADWMRAMGAEGTGLYAIEHLSTRSSAVLQINEYTNCIYCCRFCNGARSNKPTSLRGASLLNPTIAVWADHFELRRHRLHPKKGNKDARYTHMAYDLDDPRKVKMRKLRYQLYVHHLPLILDAGSRRINTLLDLAKENSHDNEALRALVESARMLRQARARAIADLQSYSFVPEDAPSTCRCKIVGALMLPDILLSQTLELDGRSLV